MKARYLLSFLWLAVLGTFLGLSSPVHADDNPMVNDARKDLEKAWNPSGEAPSNADRITLLKSALQLLRNAPPEPWPYSNHVWKAEGFIKSALYELGKGDPDHKASDFIHSAVEEVRDIS